MEKTRYSFSNPRHVSSFRSLMQILPQSSTLQGITVLLEDMHIIVDPLLNEDRNKCCRKTEDEGHEPENIDAYVRGQWVEFWESWWWSGRDGDLWGNGGKLLGNLREDGRMLLKVVHHFILGFDLQVCFAINHKCREGSRK
jgi:hypothetical protein